MSIINNIKRYLIDKNILLYISTLLFIEAIILYACEYFKLLRVSVFLPIENFFIISLILFAFSITFYFQNKINQSKRRNTLLRYVKFTFITILILIANIKLITLLYSNIDITSIYFFIIKYTNLFLVITASIAGSLIFICNNQDIKKEETVGMSPIKNNKKYLLFLLIIILIFIISRLVIPFLYTGSYTDEYSHLNSGVEILNSGHPIETADYSSGYYTRGYYISTLVALFFKIFGKSILVAKFIPAIIGIINFIILYAISKMVISDRKYRLLLLLIYTLSPLIIFNDFYIRMYIFYEFFTLVNIYLILKILSFKKTKQILIYGASIIILNLINIVFSKDQGSLLVALIPLLFIVIRYFQTNKILYNLNAKSILTKFKIILTLFSSISLFVILNIPGKIINFLVGEFPGTTPPQLKYDNLFFNDNAFLMIFLLIGIFGFFKIKNETKETLILITAFMMGLHFISSPDIQLSRTILYLIPLFYLTAILVMENFENVINKKFILSTAFLITVFNPSLLNFIKLPEIREEVYYIDYKDVADFISNNCQNKKTYILHPSYNQNFYQFYNINIDYIPYIRPEYLKEDQNFIKTTNTFFSKIGNTEVIENNTYLQEAGSICIVSPNRYRFAWRNITESDFQSLDTLFKKKSFTTLNIYY